MKLTFQKASKKPVRVDVTQLTNSLWDRVYSEENHDIQINGYTLQAGFITEEHLYEQLEELNIPVYIVNGSYTNIKITIKSDLDFAKLYIQLVLLCFAIKSEN